MWEEWIAQWTPEEIRTTLTFTGGGTISIIGFWVAVAKWGWPWPLNIGTRKRGE